MSFYGTKLKVFEQITKGYEKNVVEQTTLDIIAVTSNDISLKTSGKVACTIHEVHATNMISHILISTKRQRIKPVNLCFWQRLTLLFYPKPYLESCQYLRPAWP